MNHRSRYLSNIFRAIFPDAEICRVDWDSTIGSYKAVVDGEIWVALPLNDEGMLVFGRRLGKGIDTDTFVQIPYLEKYMDVGPS